MEELTQQLAASKETNAAATANQTSRHHLEEQLRQLQGSFEQAQARLFQMSERDEQSLLSRQLEMDMALEVWLPVNNSSYYIN